MKPTIISHFVLMGEALPKSGSAIKGRAPTQDYPWTAAISAKIAEDFKVEELKTVDKMTPAEIAGDLADCDPRVEKLVRRGYFLKETRSIRYQGQELLRSYDEGGRTSQQSWMSRMLNRPNVSLLTEQRHKLLADDYAHELSKQHKSETVVVEWSGTSVLNELSSKEDISNAIAARIENVKQLMRHGYRHFVLLNMPEKSLTSTSQTTSATDRETIREYAQEFNRQLDAACKELADKFSNYSIEVFDAAKIYRENLVEGQSIDQMQDIIAQCFDEDYKAQYNFQPGKEAALELSDEAQLIAAFRTAYNKTLDKSRQSFFGNSSTVSRVEKDDQLSLDKILMHALYNGGGRSLKVMRDLHWIDAKGNLYLNNKALKESFERVQAAEEASMAHRHGPI